jgi:acetyl-CoA C-acetyltransferase
VQADLDARPPTTIVDRHAGRATVASYTVAHGREGGPAWGLVLADVGERARAYARVEDADLLADLEREEWVGRSVDLVPEDRSAGTVNLVRAG